MSGSQDNFIPLVEPWISPSSADAVRDQILTGFLGPGPCSNRFADRLAAMLQAKSCVLTVSGTVALSVSALAVGLQPGDEILVPAYGVISTINGFASIGLCPRLVDIDMHSGCMDVDLLECSITSKTRAVCFVNFSGYTGANLVRTRQLCDEYGLLLIEDSACALGQSFQGKAASSFGHVGISSFSVPKIVTTGQGGAVVTSDAAVARKAAALIDHGDLEWRKTNLNREVGTNLRFNDILAAFGLAQLEDLGERQARKRRAFAVLQQHLGEFLFDIAGGEAPLHHVVFSEQPDDVVRILRLQGIGAVRQYRTICQHPAYAHMALQPFPSSDWWTDHAVYLPFGLALTEQQTQRIASAVTAAGSLLPIRERMRQSA